MGWPPAPEILPLSIFTPARSPISLFAVFPEATNGLFFTFVSVNKYLRIIL